MVWERPKGYRIGNSHKPTSVLDPCVLYNYTLEDFSVHFKIFYQMTWLWNHILEGHSDKSNKPTNGYSCILTTKWNKKRLSTYSRYLFQLKLSLDGNLFFPWSESTICRDHCLWFVKNRFNSHFIGNITSYEATKEKLQV